MGFENRVPARKKASDPVRLQGSLPVDSPTSLFCVVPRVGKKPLCFSLKSPHLCCGELVALVASPSSLVLFIFRDTPELKEGTHNTDQH